MSETWVVEKEYEYDSHLRFVNVETEEKRNIKVFELHHFIPTNTETN